MDEHQRLKAEALRPAPEPKKELEPPGSAGNPMSRPDIDPDAKKEIYKVFGDVWYDYDEPNGYVKKEKYKQIMNFVRVYKKIPEKKDGIFADANLEEAFDSEEATHYKDEKRKPGQIMHKGVS